MSGPPRTARTLAVRSDSIGDVLLTEPALRAIAARSDLTLLCSPHGRSVLDVLPCSPASVVFDAPWISADPPPLEGRELSALVRQIAAQRFDTAVIFTSERQTAVPMAMALRLAGVPKIGAYSDHYPGSLLDVRLRSSEPDGGPTVHEVERNLGLAAAMGFPAPADRRLRAVAPRVTDLRPELRDVVEATPFVVVHAGATAPARSPAPERWIDVVRALSSHDYRVVLTGLAADRSTQRLAAAVPGACSLVGCTSLPELAAVLGSATAVCVGNTGALHLAAAMGTPIVAVFPPTVPLARWRPWGVDHVVLGDQHIGCAPCYRRVCPFPDHPCCDVDPHDVVAAVDRLGRRAPPAPARPTLTARGVTQ